MELFLTILLFFAVLAWGLLGFPPFGNPLEWAARLFERAVGIGRPRIGPEALIGETALAGHFEPRGTWLEGRVRLGREMWRARTRALPEGGLRAGEAVRVVALEGATLIVEPARLPRESSWRRWLRRLGIG